MIGIEIGKLIEEAKQGNEAAVELLIRGSYKDIYRFIRWKVGDADLAWDLAQTTFEKAWIKLDGFHGEGESFRAWLFAIARHACIDYRRSKPARQAAENGRLPDNVADGSDFLEGLLVREEVGQVYRAMQILPEEQRDALILRYKHELSFAEIAEATEVTEATAKSRVHRSLIKLRKLLASAPEEKPLIPTRKGDA